MADDNLFERLNDLSIGTGSKTPLAAIARIEELIEEGSVMAQKLDAAEAALPAVYRLALEDAVNTLRTKQNHLYTTRCDEFVQTRTRDVLEMADMIEASPTPTAAELMARIQTGENK